MVFMTFCTTNVLFLLFCIEIRNAKSVGQFIRCRGFTEINLNFVCLQMVCLNRIAQTLIKAKYLFEFKTEIFFLLRNNSYIWKNYVYKTLTCIVFFLFKIINEFMSSKTISLFVPVPGKSASVKKIWSKKFTVRKRK